MSDQMTEAARKAHEDRVKEDYEAMRPWLPENVRDVLDIGCGLPLIDVCLAQHYGKGVKFHLMDGEKRVRPIGKEQVGFQESTRPWKSRHTAVEFFRHNVPQCEVQGHKPDAKLTIPCDLIISRRAWGHHFPVRTYISLADRSVRKGGRIILDIRIGSDSPALLEGRGFRVLSDQLEVRSVKCKRWVLER
jgi:hypothetical protein